MRPLQILFVTPEIEPFVKVGGLADMAGALPKALAAAGHDVRLVCPAYGSLRGTAGWHALAEPLGVEVGAHTHWARTWETVLPGTRAPVYFLEHHAFFARPEVYSGPWGAHGDNDLRFIFFARAALTLCLQLGWTPDVIHCHDWTTGFVPVFLNTLLRDTPLGRSATVLTIHNLEHQGYADRRALEFARLPATEFRADSVESLGAVNLLKAGLYHATKLTTVSPTYAREIRTPAGGCGLDGVLNFRGADLVGIINGIDTDTWNPATDPLLPAHYTAADLAGKATCKTALQARLGLTQDPRAVLFGVVSRLAAHKGLDLLAAVLPQLLDRLPVQFAILGSGDAGLENAFRSLAAHYPRRAGVVIGFDDGLSHLIQAGADFFVMPSRAEPCGLTQLYAMRYGTPPVARATGGLADTITPWTQVPGDQPAATGFLFDEATPPALSHALSRACALHQEQSAKLLALRLQGMARDSGWHASAARYLEVYRWAIAARNPAAALESRAG